MYKLRLFWYKLNYINSFLISKFNIKDFTKVTEFKNLEFYLLLEKKSKNKWILFYILFKLLNFKCSFKKVSNNKIKIYLNIKKLKDIYLLLDQLLSLTELFTENYIYYIKKNKVYIEFPNFLKNIPLHRHPLKVYKLSHKENKLIMVLSMNNLKYILFFLKKFYINI